MATDPYIPGNSIKDLTNQRKVEKSYEKLPENMKAIGKKKKGRILSWILPEDIPDIQTYLRTVTDGIMRNIVVPYIQKALSDSFNTVIGINPANKPINRNGGGLLPKVSYNQQYGYSSPVTATNKKSYIMYQDIYLGSENACKEFKRMITDLFDDQGGYISVLQYMDIAGEETFPEQQNYGWTSLNGFGYRYTVDGWLVSMSYPVPINI